MLGICHNFLLGSDTLLEEHNIDPNHKMGNSFVVGKNMDCCSIWNKAARVDNNSVADNKAAQESIALVAVKNFWQLHYFPCTKKSSNKDLNDNKI